MVKDVYMCDVSDVTTRGYVDMDMDVMTVIGYRLSLFYCQQSLSSSIFDDQLQ